MAEINGVVTVQLNNPDASPTQQNKPLHTILRRRDICKFTRDIYVKILNIIMRNGSLSEAISLLVDTIQDLCDGKIPYEDLVIYKTVKPHYQSEFYCMKIFSDELKKLGKTINPGDHLGFVLVEDDKSRHLGYRMRSPKQYFETLNTGTPEHIDYNYYINSIAGPIEKLFAFGFKDDISDMKHIYYQAPSSRKRIYLDRPVHMISKMRERGYDIKVLKEAIRRNTMKEAPQ